MSAVVTTLLFGSFGVVAATGGLDVSESVSQAAQLSAGIARQIAATEALIAILPSTSTGTGGELSLAMIGGGVAMTLGTFLLLRRRPRS